jgi:hypothetical protein
VLSEIASQRSIGQSGNAGHLGNGDPTMVMCVEMIDHFQQAFVPDILSVSYQSRRAVPLTQEIAERID